MSANMIGPGLAMELTWEAQQTRKLLERIPAENFDFTPHEKSWNMQKLVGHIAETPGWLRETMNLNEFVMPTDYRPSGPSTPEEVLAMFDKNVADGIALLNQAPDSAFFEDWAMVMNGKKVLSMPRLQVARSFVFSHLIHHRGQLTVYARMCDILLPAIYGNSADDPGMLAG